MVSGLCYTFDMRGQRKAFLLYVPVPVAFPPRRVEDKSRGGSVFKKLGGLMNKEEMLKLIHEITWTVEDAICNCEYDDPPNDAFDKGAEWMKGTIISILSVKEAK